ncbi:hypothetical protein H6F43_04115 [Leptolyngbya sp. FACHB-36]|uniref:hypothetical protein n=1 Tax=Leptolyngbya sp. FACHB-36 TaxID=2692808 RepID=UPI001680AA9F|nr:hypothetical protein [Leptolyngbya sp. FACHB-36]MBD2019368.1 hypothetical protein [Leptolyngbya sp. FACHB-36]
MGMIRGVTSIDARSRTQKRNTIVSGRVNTTLANYPPNCLEVQSGLTVRLAASAASPVIVTFANGFQVPAVTGRSLGAQDFTTAIVSNLTVTVPANNTSFIYLDRDSATGVVTLASTTVAPFYGRNRPASPVTSQHHFDTIAYQMSRWTGSVWTTTQRVFVGEVVAGASTISSITTYAYAGLYESDWVTVSAPGARTIESLMGMPINQSLCRILLLGRVNSSDSRPSPLAGYYFSSGDFGAFALASTANNPRIQQDFYVGTYPYYDASTSAWLTSADIKAVFERGF